MTVSAPRSDIGRHLFGGAAFATGLITSAWPHYTDWDQPVAGAAQIVAGAAMQFPRSSKTGAAVLGVVYLVFALLCVPRIVAAPQVYDRWGNFFERGTDRRHAH